MASIIRVKRSTGNAAPSTINYGELAVTIAPGTNGNLGSRLFVGDNTSPDPNPIVIGGKYFTDLIAHAPGEVRGKGNGNSGTLANGFIPILKSDGASLHPGGASSGFGPAYAAQTLPTVDSWTVDNLTFDGSTIYSNNSNGDIRFVPNGSGQVIINDDTKLSFGMNEDLSIEFDENGTDHVRVTKQSSCQGIIFDGVPLEIINPGIGDGLVIDNIGISSNVISSKSGGGNTIFIDPYPDGLDSDGMVIIKGSLQVDGTTTTVNSTNATLNDPVMHIGDVTSQKTVTATIASGVSTATLDSVVGINTGDILTATSINASGVATVSSYNTSTKVVTFSGTTSAGIATETQITVTHAFDTNTDRGISFAYNTGTGSANNKTGFFGYIDEGSTNTLSNAPDRSWTYIPEATVTSNNATGVRGFLDVKGLYFQSSDYASGGNGIMYFDATGKSVVSAGTTAGITTSNFVLTTNAAGVPKWTNTLDGGIF